MLLYEGIYALLRHRWNYSADLCRWGCSVMRKILIITGILALMLGFLVLGYKCGIRHAMQDSHVSVYLDGVVILELDGVEYEHEAF